MPRSAYIHVPFCRRRCGYCNFTLIAGRDDLTADYLRALELELAAIPVEGDYDTLFFGGGTPTHLPTRELTRLCDLVVRTFPPAPHCEWSVEANPEDVNAEKTDILRDAGATRLSLGVQSFQTAKLRTLERVHTAQDIDRAFHLAKAAFHSVSVDLIFAAPGETLSQWGDDLECAAKLQPHHVSVYGLTYERGAPFMSRLLRGDLQESQEELQAEMVELAMDVLASANFEHYEISNYAMPDHRCRHNEQYWLGGEYHAVGPGAARYVDGKREMNHKSIFTWMKRLFAGQSAIAETEQLPPQDAARERLVFGLRRLQGVDDKAFQHETGFTIQELAPQAVANALKHGLLESENGRIRLTRKGVLVSDSICASFL